MTTTVEAASPNGTTPGPSGDPIISIAGLHVALAHKPDQPRSVILEKVAQTIWRGEFVALVGASGCGKTTLLNVVAGLLSEDDYSGTVDVAGGPPDVRRGDVGYMLARDALLPWRTAVRNVELLLEVHTKMSRKERRARAMEMLARVGLEGAAGKYRGQLSQGMRQRVALARTLAIEPSILLMDEPFAALDAGTKLKLQSEFLEIWENAPAEERQTVLFVTHDLQEALLLADRVIAMAPDPGRIVYEAEVPLPRPRGGHLHDVLFEPEFRSMHHDLFQTLNPTLGK